MTKKIEDAIGVNAEYPPELIISKSVLILHEVDGECSNMVICQGIAGNCLFCEGLVPLFLGHLNPCQGFI